MLPKPDPWVKEAERGAEGLKQRREGALPSEKETQREIEQGKRKAAVMIKDLWKQKKRRSKGV